MSDVTIELAPEVARAIAQLTIAELRKNPAVAPQWLSLQDAAAYLGISSSSLAQYMRQGVAPPSVKFARNARRFRVSELDAWVLAGGPKLNHGRDTVDVP